MGRGGFVAFIICRDKQWAESGGTRSCSCDKKSVSGTGRREIRGMVL